MTREAPARLRERLRRLRFGLSTVLGLKRLGFFIPYRYAAGLDPVGYPALAPLFQDAETRFRAVVAEIESREADILRIRDGDGPARFDQDWFPRLDAAAAYALVRCHRPGRIVEVGSGHSTRFLARAAADAALSCEIAAIDPAPRAALAGLGIRHHPYLLSEADPALFEALEPSDILFVDSSHVAMPGTDLDRLLGDILPRLRAGVLVHLHDILLPDPYPAAWRWRGYNEQIAVAALLQGDGYELLFSSHWVATRHPDWIETGLVGRLPAVPGSRDTSLWLRKRPRTAARWPEPSRTA